MAKVIAETLAGDLDVLLVHKLGAPWQPELAIGAVDEAGQAYLLPHLHELRIGQNYVEGEIGAQLDVIRRRRRLYTPQRAPIDPSGRIVIVVDDGCATGSTLTAGLRAVRAKHPAKLVAAVAVASLEASALIAAHADEVICLETPETFLAVGEFFRDFSTVTDEDVIAALRDAKSFSSSCR
jgi:predicted phosphoribosyltransferase